jgi:hypothetical protein
VSHSHDDDLAVMALGETASPVDRDHVATCAQCQTRLEQYASTVASARSVTPADRLVAAPESVWRGILDELDSGAPAGAPATVMPITSARSRRGTWLVAVAAGVVGVALGAVVTSGVLTPSADEQVVASATLAPIEDSGFSGTATVARLDDAAVLTVSVPGLPSVPDGYYEVWMATPDTATMVAIGTLSPGAETTFALPAGMEVGSFPVVDVSVEHFDGDAGHSATSVVRGLLGT